MPACLQGKKPCKQRSPGRGLSSTLETREWYAWQRLTTVYDDIPVFMAVRFLWHSGVYGILVFITSFGI
jgi:hypothetical protein